MKEGRRETKAAFDKEVSERQPGKDFLFEVSVNGYMHCFILLCFCQCAAFLLPLPSNHVCKCKCQIFYLPQPSSLPPSPSFPQPIITPPSFSSLSQNQNVSCQINQSTNQQQQQQQQQQQHYHHYQTGVTVAALPGDALKLSSSSPSTTPLAPGLPPTSSSSIPLSLPPSLLLLVFKGKDTSRGQH